MIRCPQQHHLCSLPESKMEREKKKGKKKRKRKEKY